MPDKIVAGVCSVVRLRAPTKKRVEMEVGSEVFSLTHSQARKVASDLVRESYGRYEVGQPVKGQYGTIWRLQKRPSSTDTEVEYVFRLGEYAGRRFPVSFRQGKKIAAWLFRATGGPLSPKVRGAKGKK